MRLPLIKKGDRGFTLIELMVASSIFIIVMVISIGAVLSIVDANRKAQSLNDVITNLNFAVESMVRDLREGTAYSPTSQSIGQSITFKDATGTSTTYEISTDPNVCLGNGGGPQTPPCIAKAVNGGQPLSITSSNVVIDYLNFQIQNADPTQQPTILITIIGHAGTSLKTQSSFKLETMVTQRALGVQS